MIIPMFFILLLGISIGATVMIIGWFYDSIENDKKSRKKEQEAYDRGYRKARRMMERELDVVDARLELLEDEVRQWIKENTKYSDLPLIGEFEPIKGEVAQIEI